MTMEGPSAAPPFSRAVVGQALRSLCARFRRGPVTVLGRHRQSPQEVRLDRPGHLVGAPAASPVRGDNGRGRAQHVSVRRARLLAIFIYAYSACRRACSGQPAPSLACQRWGAGPLASDRQRGSGRCGGGGVGEGGPGGGQQGGGRDQGLRHLLPLRLGTSRSVSIRPNVSLHGAPSQASPGLLSGNGAAAAGSRAVAGGAASASRDGRATRLRAGITYLSVLSLVVCELHLLLFAAVPVS